MEIKSEITYNDRAALYIFNYFHFPHARSRKFTDRFIIPIGVSSVFIISTIIIIQSTIAADKNIIIGIALLTILSLTIPYILLQPRILISKIKKHAKKEADVNESYRIHSMTYELSDEGLQIQTPYWKGVLYWNIIRHLGKTPEHIFLHHSEFQSYIIPRTSFRTTEEFIHFTSALLQQYHKSTGKTLAYTHIH